jgi:hypothetical protein
MSLIISTKKQKINKTADLTQYQKEYRESNIEHIRNLERLSYYKKKYNLDKEFIGLFGEFSGDAFKIIKEFNELTNIHPELAPHIISRLNLDFSTLSE